MLIVAMSEAAKTTIVYIAIWFVLFPALVTGLIAVAVVRTMGERAENERNRLHRPS